METHAAVQVITSSIEQLRMSPRGRRMGNLLRMLAREMQRADSANTRAVSDLVGVMTSHKLNGTLGDLLKVFQLERTQTSENELEVAEVIDWVNCAMECHTQGAPTEVVRRVLRDAGLAPEKPNTEEPSAFTRHIAKLLGDPLGYKYLWVAGWMDSEDQPPVRVCQLLRETSGQWRYRIVERDRVVVDWQYGSHSEDSTLEQAKSRFVYTEVERLQKDPDADPHS